MVIPERYQTARKGLEFASVNLGFNGVELFPSDAVEAGQIGFSVGPNGKSLCDGSAGAWRHHWLVIGIETLCGDPLILDTADPNFRVLYAIHGQDKWEPTTIAPTLNGFFEAIRELKKLTAGR